MKSLAYIALLALAASAQDAATWPKLLTGTGLFCSGQFSHTGTTLDWKAPATSCRSPYTVVSHQGNDWLLQVERSTTCAYDLIDVTAIRGHARWIVQGLPRQNDPHGNLACSMVPVIGKQPE